MIHAPGDHIKGWMEPEELLWLYDTAKRMDSIIEIGSWKGRSTYALCSGCHGAVYAVDTFGECLLENCVFQPDGISIYEDFRANTWEFKNLFTIPVSSVSAHVHKLVPGKVDMVFVDGSHDIDSVYIDLVLYGGKAIKMLCGHDFSWRGVTDGLVRYLEGTGIQVTHGPGDIWFIEGGEFANHTGYGLRSY
jgi:hypothetical protein